MISQMTRVLGIKVFKVRSKNKLVDNDGLDKTVSIEESVTPTSV